MAATEAVFVLAGVLAVGLGGFLSAAAGLALAARAVHSPRLGHAAAVAVLSAGGLADLAAAAPGPPAPERPPVELVELVEPVAPDPAGVWTVAVGEHFWGIAEAVLQRAHARAPAVTETAPYWLELVAANLDRLPDPGNPDLIHPAQRLTLPPVG